MVVNVFIVLLHFRGMKKEVGVSGTYLKSVVYGGLDGIITTFAVVAGVAGASLSSTVVLILGFANLLADGISMAMGDYLSSKSEREYVNRSVKENGTRSLSLEKQSQFVSSYVRQGMKKRDAQSILGVFMKYPSLLASSFVAQVEDVTPSNESPVRHGLATFFSFVVFGFIPLLTYVIGVFVPSFVSFAYAICFTVVAMALLGVLKAKVSGSSLVSSVLETLFIGSLAAGAAYAVGHFLSMAF